MINILDVGKTFGYPCAKIFEPWKPNVTEWNMSKGMEQLNKVDLVIFGGGQDVSPALYKHRNVASQTTDNPTKRDLLEESIYREATNRGVHTLGICRGAQFLCAVTGGWLVQHLDNHAGRDHIVHLVEDFEGEEEIVANSYHHQMMVPNPLSRLLGYTKQLASELIYDTKSVNNMRADLPWEYNTEIVLFTDRCLGFQCHPEYMDASHFLPRKVRHYVKHYFNLGEFK